MKLFKKLFKKKKVKMNEYAYLGSVGISPNQLHVYQNAMKLIKEFESKYKTLK